MLTQADANPLGAWLSAHGMPGPDLTHHSSVIFSSFTILAIAGISTLSQCAKSVGDMREGSAPRVVRRSRTSGKAVMRSTSALSLSTTALGVPAGASRPCQLPVRKPGSVSATVGTLDNSSWRLVLDKAIRLILSPLRCG